MRVGLVIVTHNAQGEIARCLDAVRVQTRQPDRLVLVDAGSGDGTLAEVAAAQARPGLAIEIVTFASNVGFAVANNRAVERLDDCDVVALLNPDAFPEPEWLAALLAAAVAHPDAASFASRLMVHGRPGLLDGAGDVFHVSGLVWRHGHRRSIDSVPDALIARPVFSACAAAALYRRQDWQRAGGFDETYFCYVEDSDLGFRLQLLGRHCRYVPDAVAHHVGSAAAGVDSAFSVYHGYRNLEWTFVKNMPAGLFWRYLPVHVGVLVAEFGWFVTRGRGGSLLRAKWDALLGLRRALRQRRRIQAARVATPDMLGAVLDRSSLRSRFAIVRSTE